MAQSESGPDGDSIDPETYRQLNGSAVARGVPGGRAICDFCNRSISTGETAYVHASIAADEGAVWVSWVACDRHEQDHREQPDEEGAFIAKAELAEASADPETVMLTNVRAPDADRAETTTHFLELVEESDQGDTLRVTLENGETLTVTLRSDDYHTVAWVDVQDDGWEKVGILSNPILCGGVTFRYDDDEYDVERVEKVE